MGPGPSERLSLHPLELCTHGWSRQSHLCTLGTTVCSTQAALDKDKTYLTGIKWVVRKMKHFLDLCGLTQLKFLFSCVLKSSVCFQTSDREGRAGQRWEQTLGGVGARLEGGW